MVEGHEVGFGSLLNQTHGAASTPQGVNPFLQVISRGLRPFGGLGFRV